MFLIGVLLILMLFTLIQVNILALNFGFTVVFAFFLLSRRDFSFWWVFTIAILLGLFANLNLGLVLIAFSVSFLILDLVSRVLPNNSLVKGVLIIGSLVLSEYSLLVFGGLQG